MNIIERRNQYLAGLISKEEVLKYMEDYLNSTDEVYELSYTEQATVEEIEGDYYQLYNSGTMGGVCYGY